MSISVRRSSEELPIFMCILSDVQWENDCGENDPFKCVRCPVKGGFFDGTTLDDTSSSSNIACLVLGILTVLIGLFGIFSNSIIIYVMKNRRPHRSFDVLLKILAIADIVCCTFCICDAVMLNIYFGNWTGRGVVLLYCVMIFHMGFFWIRTATTFMTILITVERFLAILFPIRAVSYCTPKSAKVCSAGMFLIATMINLPRWTSFSIEGNPYQENAANVPSLSQIDYIIRSSRLESFWFGTLKGLHYHIDFWLPLPVLLVLNILTYLRVRRIASKRKEMSVNIRMEIQALKLFLPVVIFLIVCNIFPLAKYYHIGMTKITYRELLIGLIFSVSLSSSMNFLFYYVQGSDFRKETKYLLSHWGWRRTKEKSSQVEICNPSSSNSQI